MNQTFLHTSDDDATEIQTLTIDLNMAHPSFPISPCSCGPHIQTSPSTCCCGAHINLTPMGSMTPCPHCGPFLCISLVMILPPLCYVYAISSPLNCGCLKNRSSKQS